ncbi:MAG: hypothetical protein CMF49_01915 [Legionellales bacterium]|nr:hypothetical protein [Legionellales bacterium]|tara:strand:+ start:123 stop:560 length:438 start_codon:yes stop_codon:yes gene_type:complete
MKIWFKNVWYFFLILAIAQTVKTGFHILSPNWYPKIIYFGYNLIFITTSFFLSWRTYKIALSITLTILAALTLLIIASVGINILSALIIVHIYFPAIFSHVLKQMPVALQNGLLFAPMIILIAIIACRVAARHDALKDPSVNSHH